MVYFSRHFLLPLLFFFFFNYCNVARRFIFFFRQIFRYNFFLYFSFVSLPFIYLDLNRFFFKFTSLHRLLYEFFYSCTCFSFRKKIGVTGCWLWFFLKYMLWWWCCLVVVLQGEGVEGDENKSLFFVPYRENGFVSPRLSHKVYSIPNSRPSLLMQLNEFFFILIILSFSNDYFTMRCDTLALIFHLKLS